MSTILPLTRTGALTRSNARKIDLFRRTAGKHLRGVEIDEALEWCELYGANPFVKDIYFFVFDAEKETRRVVPVLGIGLYRKIAARTGNYRPDEAPPRFAYDEALRSAANPAGMVWCEVGVHIYSHGAWHIVVSRLKWDERAPVREEWAETEQGRRRPTGRFALDPTKQNWRTMPETMMAKCCEADAIRKAWPGETAGSYVAEEMDAPTTIDATAIEIAEAYASDQRIRQIGSAHSILIQWEADGPIVQESVGTLGDTAIKWLRLHQQEPGSVQLWQDRNRFALREYWARDAAGALEVKKVTESILTAEE